MASPRTLINPKLIYIEAAVRTRGREVRARLFAEFVEMASNWRFHRSGPGRGLAEGKA